jgi:hypothetical protein
MTSMSSTLGSTLSQKYAAKHRSAPTRTLPTRLGRHLRRAALFSGVAVAATGLAVSTGVLTKGASPLDASASASLASSGAGAAPVKGLTQSELAEREQRASRSSDDRRPEADRAKARTLSNDTGAAVTRSADLTTADPRTLAKALMPEFGMSPSQFGCLDHIWSQESGWNIHADNPSSSAYGIPQALPGSKMSSAGPDWANNAETQIRWGLGYIKGRYGSPCAAWSYKQGAGWY